MDYLKIGERIRKYRKAKGFSQEYLAERIGISVTHMSHIETANTKLSLPVLVSLAQVLEIQTDDLVSETVNGRTQALGELQEILDSCTASQVRIITDIVRAAKIALDKHS